MNEAKPFVDAFRGTMHDAWQWLREEPEAWALTDSGLRIRALPGTLWGPRNDARNVLLRTAMPLTDGLSSQVTVCNRPAIQGEQGGIIWFVDEANYVKLVKECLDGTVWVVLAREEDDQGTLVSRMPFTTGDTVSLKLTLSGDTMVGQAQAAPGAEWQTVGTCAALAAAQAQLGICVHGGPEDEAHWAELSEFTINS